MNQYNELKIDIKHLSSDKLKTFSKSILNTKLGIVGIYSKDIKMLIKKYKDIDIRQFELDKIYEINFLYFAIGLKQLKTLDEQIKFIKENIVHIDSWAITDSTYQYFLLGTYEESLPVINDFISSDKEFLIRYGYLFLFNYLKDESNYKSIISLFRNSDFFYVKMVEAWVISYLYIYFPDKTYEYLKTSNLTIELKKMSIRKVLDSYRVSKTEKEKLKALRAIL